MTSHFEGDDDFKEYDPDPYEGGYDIALTYGLPLSPSPSTCYPLSQDSDHRPQPPPPSPPKESGHRSEPHAPLSQDSDHHPQPPPLSPPKESGHRSEPHAPLPPTQLPEPDYRNSYDYGESGHRPEGYWPDLDVFGFASACESLRSGFSNGADVEEVGYWNQWKRAGDYLFGYSQGYGERRIGVDSYGIPIYANKKEWSQPVTLQIEPARDLKVDCYESDGWFSSYDEKDKNYGYAYNKHHSQEPLHVEENLTEPILHQRVTYHEAYEDQVYPKLEWWFSSYDEDKSYGYAYNKHHCQEPLHVEENLTEPMLHQRLSYHEAYEDQVYPKLEWQRCQREYGDENNFYSNDQYGYERQYSEQPLCVELEPYKPTWSQNLNYQEFYNGEVSLESNYQSLADYDAEEQNFSGNLNDAYGRHFHEQPLCVQLEPFKPAWAQNPTFYEPYMQEVPQSSWAGDTFKEYGAEFFSPFF